MSIPTNPGNRVLEEGFCPSTNFYYSDLILRNHLESNLPNVKLAVLGERLQVLGEQAAGAMNAMSMNADKQGPVLKKRDMYGETIDEVVFHPDYQSLLKIAVDSGMFRLKWNPADRESFRGSRHAAGFALGYLYAMAESGQYCPLCMTDGVALLLDKFAPPEIKERLLPRIATQDVQDFFTGAMFLTEKAGGSDVGANLVLAKHVEGRKYTLHGEKWFCSNVNAEIIFALARTNPDIPGTKGLSIFLVEGKKEDGTRNPLGIVRLKDKLGVRSMASAECIMDGTEATLIGEEFHGFRIMTEMINLSRMYNSVAALSGGRRAMIEAWQFLGHRQAFGRMAREHVMVRGKFWELASLHLANFHLVWRAIHAMDAAEEGSTKDAELLRLLTPMVKRSSAEASVYLARESMELMGGMGYIEDSVMPKILRDVNVLPIWEGAGNIMVLDMLRAVLKSGGLSVMMEEIEGCGEGVQAAKVKARGEEVSKAIKDLEVKSQDEIEWGAKQLFLRLTKLYACALILKNESSSGRAEDALSWLLNEMEGTSLNPLPPDSTRLAHLVGWEY